MSWAPTGDELAYTVRGGVERTVLTTPAPRSSRLVAGSGVGTSFGGEFLAYSGPNPRCSGHDAIRILPGNVVAGDCEIRGTAASDVIDGTRQGGDVIVAGAGNDTIRARNGHRDLIACGAGRDVVRADRVDRLSGCEVVER